MTFFGVNEIEWFRVHHGHVRLLTIIELIRAGSFPPSPEAPDTQDCGSDGNKEARFSCDSCLGNRVRRSTVRLAFIHIVTIPRADLSEVVARCWGRCEAQPIRSASETMIPSGPRT